MLGTMVDFPLYDGAMGALRYRLVEQTDAEFILALRTDPALGEHLSETSTDIAMQREWLARYKEDEKSGRQLYYIIVLNGEPVGKMRLYDIRPDSFKSGSWILRPGLPATVSVTTVLFGYDLCYEWMNLPTQYIAVRKGNESVLRLHRNMGAQQIREDDEQYYFELTQQAYFEVRPRYQRLARCEGQSIVWTKVR